MIDLHELNGPNAAYVLDVYERYLADATSVDPGWRDFFSALPAGALDALQAAAPAPAAAAGAAPADVDRIIAARELSRAIRARGHTAARLSPLGVQPTPDPALDPAFHGLTEAELAALPPAVVKRTVPGARSALSEVQRLREVYSGTIGYDYLHIPYPEERGWLRQAIESGEYRAPLSPERKRALLERLTRVEGFERYLHRAFFGQKRFSIEGTDAMVPVLDELVRAAAAAGARDVVIGMAHRGRLNVLTHVLRKPYAKMLEGFLGAAAAAGPDPADLPSGDVKYHMGWRSEREEDGHPVTVTLSPNPSHLEFVNPVVVGMTRAAQDDTAGAGAPRLDVSRALGILIHGDAAFPGQGVVAETFNMSALRGYAVGGTIHVIANNQVGFTTDPDEGRSTRYASDLAKGFEVPVVHVNADDAEACLAVARLAFAYRARFGKDFVIDLVGYRRWGHNEGDEPFFTQPVMYEAIKDHPTARELLARRLEAEGVVSAGDARALQEAVQRELEETLEALKAGGPEAKPAADAPSANGRRKDPAATAVDAETLRALNASLTALPEGFRPFPRLQKQVLQRRAEALDAEDGTLDWGHAELLAFATLLAEGTPVRLTGQDAERGTFSHRHAVLHDVTDGAEHNALQTLPQARATFEVHNSPLSEMAVMGFEYGYSVWHPGALVLWEAQFGDFVNGAQVIIDQYLSASKQKWGQTSGLVLLLPHGYEGQGPEHSSARLERFLQLCGQDNLRVVNATTAGQYFHLLRRQAALLESDPRPLVVMSPKSLLRHPLATATLADLASGAFRPVLVDLPFGGEDAAVTRLLLCSGKVYVDLVGSTDEQRAARRARDGAERVAVARVEELYPFPAEELEAALARFPGLREVAWVQEEPANMGAWSYVEPRLRDLLDGRWEVTYVGRPGRASPAEGYAHRHAEQQERIVEAALSGVPEAAAARAR